jgi:DNA-binding CsgD family transcriptional regulator/tetratricopeptide (TPR) repeat protein
VRDGGGLIVSLRGLAPAAVRAMAAALIGADPGPRLLRRLGHASGNPFFIRELTDEAARSGTLQAADGLVDLVTGADRPSGGDDGLGGDSVLLRAAVESRLDFLCEPARRVLRVAALLGPKFLVSDLAAVSERSPAQLLPVIEDAFAAGILEDAGAQLRFRHALLRQALHDGIQVPVRAALHRQAARALMELDASAERVAQQLFAVPAGEAMTDREVRWLADRAEHLVRRAPEVAVDLLERACRQTPAGTPERARLEDPLLDALFVLGRFEPAEQLAREVLPAVTDPDRYGQVAWLMTYSLMRLRRYGDAEVAVAAAAGRTDVSPAWQARFTALRAMLGRYTDSRARAEDYACAALAAGRELDDAVAVAYALHALSVLRWDDGDLEASIRLTDEALTAAEHEPWLRDLWLMMSYNRVGLTADLERYSEAWDMAQAILARPELSGSPRVQRLYGSTAQIAYELGRWDEALAGLEACADDDDETSEAAYLRVLISAHRDEWREAEGRLAALRRSTGGYAPPVWPRSPSMSALIVAIAVLDLDHAGTPERAAGLLSQWLEPAQEDRLLPLIDQSLPGLMRMCLATGDRPAAESAAKAAEREAQRSPLVRKQAAAQWCRSLVNGDPGGALEAAALFDGLGQPLSAGGALEDAAMLLAQAGPLPPARAALGEALDRYDQVGAAWDARRTVARARQYGIRSGVRRPRRRPRTGWEALTATERQVAELVAAGCSNPDIAARLFISRRTVEAHASRILAKLQVSSRWEVRTAAEQAGADSPVPIARLGPENSLLASTAPKKDIGELPYLHRQPRQNGQVSSYSGRTRWSFPSIQVDSGPGVLASAAMRLVRPHELAALRGR